MSQFPPQNERLVDRSTRASQAHDPSRRSGLAWTALVLAAAAVIVSIFGSTQGWFGLSSTVLSLAAAAGVVGVFVLAVIAVKRKAQPRWVAMTALAISVVAVLPVTGVIVLTVMSLLAFLAR